MVEKRVLNNGVRVLIEKLPHLRSCAVGIWAESGSRHETPDVSGISHFIEHMLFKGTETKSARDLACAFDEIGGQVNAFTSRDHTCYYARTTDEHLMRAFTLLLDMYVRPAFDKKETDLERGVIFEEIDMYEDTPDDLCSELLSQAIYKGDPLGMPVLGTKESLSGITPEILRQYHAKRYTAERTVVSLCGKLKDGDIDKICALLESVPGGGEKARDGAVKYIPSVVLKRKKIEQNHIVLGFEGVPLGDPDRFVMQALNNILGAGMSSRLFQEVREKHGLCYSVYSYCANYEGAGMLGIYTGLSAENEKDAVNMILSICKKMKAGDVTGEELSRSREQLKTTLLMGMESTVSRMTTIARNEMVYGREVSEDELIEGINSVRREDIARLANRVFVPEKTSFSAVGAVAKKSEYLALLQDIRL